MDTKLELLQLCETRPAMRKVDGKWVSSTTNFKTNILYDRKPYEYCLGRCQLLNSTKDYLVFGLLDKKVIQDLDWLRECLQLQHKTARVTGIVDRYNIDGSSVPVSVLLDNPIKTVRIYAPSDYHGMPTMDISKYRVNSEYEVTIVITHLYQSGTNDATIQFKLKSIV